MTSKYPQVGDGIRKEKQLSKSTEEALKRGIADYKKIKG
jgi:hypothetical protein